MGLLKQVAHLVEVFPVEISCLWNSPCGLIWGPDTLGLVVDEKVMNGYGLPTLMDDLNQR